MASHVSTNSQAHTGSCLQKIAIMINLLFIDFFALKWDEYLIMCRSCTQWRLKRLNGRNKLCIKLLRSLFYACNFTDTHCEAKMSDKWNGIKPLLRKMVTLDIKCWKNEWKNLMRCLWSINMTYCESEV